MKIDKRHTYGIMLDTETVNGLDDPLFYDIGWQIIDSHGRKYLERSYINSDVYYGMRDLMDTCYYKEKLPQYEIDIKSGKRIVLNTYQIKAQMKEDSEKYGCVFVCAHNAFFDYKSTNGTQRYLTKSKYRYFVPYGLEWWDTMRMAQSVIAKMPTYKKFCIENDYMTGKNRTRISMKAEHLFRFIIKDTSFIESHTGLEDVDIERQILAYCVNAHKKGLKRQLFNPKPPLDTVW